MTITQAPQLTGAAGVYFVAAELSIRGLIALPTNRNSRGVDILVSNSEGTRFAHIQVKTSKGKVNFWPLSEKYREWTGENCYYAFVRRVHGKFEVFLEHASVVIAEAEAADKMAEQRGNKKWAPWWPMTGQDAAVGSEARTRKQWEEFTLTD